MTSINYETTSDGIELTTNAGGELGTITHLQYGFEATPGQVWFVDLPLMKRSFRFFSLEAAKYWALAMHIDHMAREKLPHH